MSRLKSGEYSLSFRASFWRIGTFQILSNWVFSASKKSVRKSGQSQSTIAFVMNGTRLFIDRIPWRPELINTHFEVSSSSASQINKKTVTPKHLVHTDISYTLTFGTPWHLVHPDIWYTLTFGTPRHLVHPDIWYTLTFELKRYEIGPEMAELWPIYQWEVAWLQRVSCGM